MTKKKTTSFKKIIQSLTELSKKSFQDFALSIAYKIFINQSSNNSIYDNFIFKINCDNFNISDYNINNSKEEIKDIINDVYLQSKEYINTKLKS